MQAVLEDPDKSRTVITKLAEEIDVIPIDASTIELEEIVLTGAQSRAPSGDFCA